MWWWWRSFSTAALFSTFLLAVFDCCWSGIAEHELLGQYLGIACQRERINVQMTFNRKRHPEMTKSIREMIWRGRICIGEDKSGTCCSQLNMIQDHHIVSVGYSKCGIEKTFFAGGFNFIAKVHFWGVSNVNEKFEVQCAVPFVESHVKAKMIASRRPIRLSSVDFVNTQHSSSSSIPPEPVSIRLGSNLHVAIEPTIEGMQKRLHTYPLSCWVSAAATTTPTTKQLANAVEFSRRYFIEDGCPSADDNSLLAFLEQKTGPGRYAEWTKMTIPITRNLVSTSLLNGTLWSTFRLCPQQRLGPSSEESPPKVEPKKSQKSVVVDESVEYGRISLHCDVIFCTGHKLKGFQNTPTCPRATFCSPASGERRQLPSWIEPHIERAVTVTLGYPIRILLANASEPSLDNDDTSSSDELVAESDDNPINAAYDSKCAGVCAVAADEALRKEEEYHLDGIPVYVVIIIAIISFGFGVAFVATLWFIHNKTDPLRKIRCADRNGRALPLNAIYRDSIIRPLNNANAFMAPGSTAVAERERLVVHEGRMTTTTSQQQQPPPPPLSYKAYSNK